MIDTLPADHIACRWCGQPVPEGDGGPRWYAGSFGHPDRLRQATLGICSACTERNEEAERIGNALPREDRAALGDMPLHRIAEVLRALAVLGEQPDDMPPDFWEAASYWINRDLTLMQALDWSEQYADEGIAKERSCTTAPFALADPQAVRSALASVADEARAVGARDAVRLPPPQGRGCAWCGLDGIDEDPRAVYRVGGPKQAARERWRLRRQGRMRWLCPHCADAAGGQQGEAKAVRIAALVAAGIDPEAAPRLPMLVPFFRSDAAPSPEPWAHIGGVQAVVDAVKEALEPPPLPTLEHLAARLDELSARVDRLEQALR